MFITLGLWPGKSRALAGTGKYILFVRNVAGFTTFLLTSPNPYFFLVVPEEKRFLLWVGVW